MHPLRAFATTAALLAGAAYAQDCVMTVPANPLSAAGLATPYQVTGCDQTQTATASFVECAIYDNAGTISIYHPLVVNQGGKAGVDFTTPVPATVPSGATVGCWFGTNGASLTFTGPGAGQCTNGLGGSIFGQFAHCGGDKWFNKALADLKAGIIVPPPLGQGIGGACPTTRDFRIVDQDQSDNVVSTYLAVGSGNGTVLMQNTPTNSKNVNGTVLSNGSDNGLLDIFIAPALGCTPWMVQSPTAPTGKTPALALNELVATANNGAALVPLNDPMVLVNGQQSLQKVNLYRVGVGQPQAATPRDADPKTYCLNILVAGIFIAQDMALFQGMTSPAPTVANNLYTFLAQRFATSINADNLGCFALLNFQQPVTLTTDGNGIVTAATINTQVLQAIIGAGNGTVAGGNGGASNGTTTGGNGTASGASSGGGSLTSVSAPNQAAQTSTSPSAQGGMPAPTTLQTMATPQAGSGAGSVSSPPAAGNAPTSGSTTTVLTVPSSTITLTTAVSALTSSVACTSASVTFKRDHRGAIWDGQYWHVRVDFVGVEWVDWAGPAPTVGGFPF